MTRLGYQRVGAQGGDIGSFVSANLGTRHPDRVVGIHLNMVVTGPPRAEQHFRTVDSAHHMQQRTRPQTLACTLADSPAGQCARILEKFWSWTNCAGDPVAALGADRILDHVATCWSTNSTGSSARMYCEMAQNFASRTPTVAVPTGVSLFPHEIMQPTEEWPRAQYTDLRMWREHDRGGHFAAMEQPERLVRDVREFFRPLR